MYTGYANTGDGGEEIFFWDNSSVEADNDGTIISTGLSEGRWKRFYSGAVNVKWFGAKGMAELVVMIKLQLNML